MRYATGKRPGPDGFVHCHLHSEYSVLDGLCRIARGKLSIRGRETKGDTIAAVAKELRMGAVAVTDHGTLGGWLRHVHECEELGLRPIVGVEFYVAGDMRDKSKDKRFEEDHLVVLARNYRGLVKLFRLTSLSYEEGFYQRPRIDEETLLRHAGEGDLVVLSGCVSSKLARLTLGDRFPEARAYASRMMEATAGNFFVELQPHDFREQIDHNLGALDVARAVGAPIVATNDAHYLRESDHGVHDAMLCLQTARRITDEDRFRFTGDGYHLRTRMEMLEAFARCTRLDLRDVREALDGSLKVADLVDLRIEKQEGLSPEVPVPDRYASKAEWLTDLCREGAERFGVDLADDRYRERLEREVGVIDRMGYLDYFLTVRSLYEHVAKVGIPRGPGRGSVGGSLVAYLLDVTMVDPIRFDLQFERFLNPARKNPPDIDMDFADDARGEVFRWFKERFGEENVAHIGTWSTLQARGAVRDVCRVYGVSQAIADRVAGAIPNDPGKVVAIDDVDLSEIEAISPDAAAVVRGVEGLTRAKGCHAAGIVASPRLRDVVPLELRGPKENRRLVTALTGKEVEKLGLVKWDVLGLSAIRAVAICLDEIERNTGLRIDLREIPLDDEKVFRAMGEGRTASVFEFDTLTTARECRHMTWERFEDFAIMGALMRPGTQRSGTAQTYYRRRRGDEPVPRVHPAFDEVTRDTLGVVIFEEQLTGLFHKLAGFTLEEADEARVVVAKSQGTAKFEEYRGRFVDGAVANGMDRARADELFDDLLAFSGYAFNKAHSVEYGMLGYWTAWLRENYPAEWWVGAMSAESKRQKVAVYAREARERGVEFLPPCVERSGMAYRTEDGAVRCGFLHVLGIGDKAAEEIEAAQPFGDFWTFLDEVNRRVVNRRVIEALARCDAFAGVGVRGDWLAERLDSILPAAKRKAKPDLCGDSWDGDDRTRSIMGALPVPFFDDPIELALRRLPPLVVRPTRLVEFAAEDGDLDGPVTVLAFVTETKTKKTSNGRPAWHADLIDSTGAAKAMVVGGIKEKRPILDRAEGRVVLIQGWGKFEASIVFADEVMILDDFVDVDVQSLPIERGGWAFREAVDEMEVGGRLHVPVDEARGPGPFDVVGCVVRNRRAKTKGGDPLRFVSIQGRREPREFVLSGDMLERHGRKVEEGAILALRCRRGRARGRVEVGRKDRIRVLEKTS